MSWVRRLSIAAGGLALLAGIGIAALYLFVDPNDYKAALQNEVQERYGRTLVIDGDIRLSLVPRLGLEVNGVSLSEPQSNQVFAVVDTARVAVPWLPLLSRHLVIEHLAVSGVKANVVRDAEGRFNFDDLIRPPVPDGAGSATPAGDPAQPSLQLAVAGIDVAGGDIAYRDERADLAVRLERLAVSASGITLGQPFDASVSARVLGQNPRLDATVQAQGRLLMNPPASRYGVHGLDLRMAGMLPSVKANGISLRGDAGLDLERGELNLTGLSLAFQGDVALARPLTGVDAQLNVPRLALDLQGSETLQTDQVTAKASGRVDNAPFAATLDIPALVINDASATGNAWTLTFVREGPRALDVRFELADITGGASHFASGRATLHAELRNGTRSTRLHATSPVALMADEAQLVLPALGVELGVVDSARAQAALQLKAQGDALADWGEGQVRMALEGTLAERPVQAEISVSRLVEAVPAVRFALTAEQLDLAPWLTPAEPARPAKPAAAGTANAGTAKPAADAAVADALFDYALLTQVDAHGSLRVGRLATPRGELHDLAATLALAEGRAELRHVSARLFDGQLAATGFADAATQRLGLNARFANVAVQPLLQAVAGYGELSGTGALQAELTATGRSKAALLQSLNGPLRLDLRDGAYRGLNVLQSLHDFRQRLARGEASPVGPDPAQSTEFAELRGTLNFADGIGTLHDLRVAAPWLRITEGRPAKLDLPRGQLDLMLNARVVNTGTGSGGKALERLRDIIIPIQVQGPLAQLSYSVLWNQVGGQALQQVLGREVGRQLDRLLGVRPAGEAAAVGAPASEAQPASQTGKILGEALKGLFTP